MINELGALFSFGLSDFSLETVFFSVLAAAFGGILIDIVYVMNI